MPTICTMVVKDNLFIGGGMKGEIICKVVRSSSPSPSPSTSFPILGVQQIIPTHLVFIYLCGACSVSIMKE
jgi:hypothetical protein